MSILLRPRTGIRWWIASEARTDSLRDHRPRMVSAFQESEGPAPLVE